MNQVFFTVICVLYICASLASLWKKDYGTAAYWFSAFLINFSATVLIPKFG